MLRHSIIHTDMQLRRIDVRCSGIIVSAMVAQHPYHADFLHVTLTLYAMHCSNVARTPHPDVDGDLRLA